MAVNIVNDKVLEKQENKNDKFKLKLLKYPKKLCEATKAIQAGFVKEFQEKFKKLKNATFTLEEVDFKKIKLNQSRSKQLSNENYKLRTEEFKLWGFLTSIIFPIVVCNSSGGYDLITGYHRIRVFRKIFHMKRSWFIVFSLPAGVELTEIDLRDMGNVANPNTPTGAKPFDAKDLAWSVIKTANEKYDIAPNTKKALEKKLSPIAKEIIDRYNYEYAAFGYMNDYQIKKLKGEVLAFAIESFEVEVVIDIFTKEELDPLIKKEQKNIKETIVAPKGTRSNWDKEVVRDGLAILGNSKLVCNFECHGDLKEYRDKKEEFYWIYVRSVVLNAWIRWMNDLEVGYGGELDDLEKWIEYVKKKVDFKYFSPMHPDHKNNKLVLAKDEVDTKFFWKRAKGLAEYLLDGTYGKARHISKYFEKHKVL